MDTAAAFLWMPSCSSAYARDTTMAKTERWRWSMPRSNATKCFCIFLSRVSSASD